MGHPLAVSAFSGEAYETGYRCDRCKRRSVDGLGGGSRERWFCALCRYDVCFGCLPRATVRDASRPSAVRRLARSQHQARRTQCIVLPDAVGADNHARRVFAEGVGCNCWGGAHVSLPSSSHGCAVQ
jgi:hypothetical protein